MVQDIIMIDPELIAAILEEIEKPEKKEELCFQDLKQDSDKSKDHDPEDENN